MKKTAAKKPTHVAKKQPVKKTAVAAKPVKKNSRPAIKATPAAKTIPAVKSVAKPVPSVKAVTKAQIPLPSKTQDLAKPAAVPVKVKSSKKSATVGAGKAPETVAVSPLIKRPTKLFFIEVKAGAERVIKRGDKSQPSPAPLDIQARRKDTAAEETSEELVERIERELQHQSFFKRSTLKQQMCTKCGITAVSPRFTLDRELGYCDGCAEILRLGNTKEARRMEFNTAAALKKEGEDGISPPMPVEAAEEIAIVADGDEEAIPDID